MRGVSMEDDQNLGYGYPRTVIEAKSPIKGALYWFSALLSNRKHLGNLSTLSGGAREYILRHDLVPGDS